MFFSQNGRWAIGRWADGSSVDGPSADGRRPTPPSFSFGMRGFQQITFFHFRKCYFNALFELIGLFLGLGTPLKSSGTL